MKILIFLYFFCAVMLTLYGINCHIMIRLFKGRYHQRRAEDRRQLHEFYGGPIPLDSLGSFSGVLPRVTTQLPLFNEFNVSERLIDAAAAMVYPPGYHEIQVLDDSTDETRDTIAAKVAEWQQKGIDIKHVRRAHRDGFKAGALRCGLARAKGEYLVIFDADFVPPPDFLLRSLPFFLQDPRIGFVQARWGHLNREESFVTRLQSIGIDGHFMIEQSARNNNGLLMNFNGTAGIFRKQAVIEAGNWQSDTLTEDMDLSYRIQLSGWRCRYLVDLVAPAEIPSDINAFKNQQFRWAKGSIQTALKLMPRILRADFSLFAKIQAYLHLTHYLVHPLMLFLAVMAPPVLLSGPPRVPAALYLCFAALLVMSCSGPSRLYILAERCLNTPFIKTLAWIPLMICFGCGLAVNNTRAVIEAVIGRQSGFVRTPKKGQAPRKSYRPRRNRFFMLELLVGLWCLAATVIYFASDLYLVGHFLLLYATGYLSIGILSWYHGTKRT
jgi:cellulose synthase/poly-beta-1,6-N-acetylglucosamine synthase-like glycosyltransferase